MNAAKIIAAKRDGHRIDDERLAELIQGYARGDVPDYQMAAFAMAVYYQGMDQAETLTLTREMLSSGSSISWADKQPAIVDKHSTGGIGDKVSIVLAPALADCGLRVPMISGRGLGATGGTLDKLESIAGFRTELSIEELQRVVNDVGCAISGASAEIAPVDRKLYALRDVTATVPSVPLITGSILSKKMAEGLDALVLDVKWGSGSFMKTTGQAQELAVSLVSTGRQLGVKTTALISDMNQPLGRMIGNAVEIDECIDVLNGSGPADVRRLTVELGAELLLGTGICDGVDVAREKISDSIDSGRALNKLRNMVCAQGGDLQAPRERAPEHVLVAQQTGYVASIDAERFGWAIIEMDGGRRKIGDKIDRSTGIEMLTRIGDAVDAGQPIMKLFCHQAQLQRMTPMLLEAVLISGDAADVPELIVEKVDG